MADGGARRRSTYIGGSWVDSAASEVITSINPATEEVIGQTAVSAPEQVDAAVAAAARAFRAGPWAEAGPAHRARVILAIADVFEKNAEDLARLVVDEVGSPITLARSLQVGGPIEALRWYAEQALKGPRGTYERELGRYDHPVPSLSVLRYEPVGVVAALTAYNYPINLLAWKLGGALASGCTTVVFPSPFGVLTTLRVFELFDEAGIPPGVVNLVVGGPQAGVRLTENPDVDLVTFTGSDAVGAKVMAQAAGSLTKSVLELGGKAANIVLPGMDPADSVANSVLRFSRNAGQGCGAWTRILVHADEYDAYLDAVAEFVAGVKVGDPHQEDTVVGPLISAAHRDRVEAAVGEALRAGGRWAAGGGRPDLARGFYVNPGVLAGLEPDSPVCGRELFAPIAVALPYRSIDEAVEIANGTDYGLNANVSGPLDEAFPVARLLRAGTVTINGGSGMRPDAPWGGIGRSGVGRELGDDGFAEFFEVKHVQWPLASLERAPGT